MKSTSLLNIGDKVAIIAPASFIKINDFYLIDKAKKVLTDWGLDIVHLPYFSRKSGDYLAGTDDERAEELIYVLENPDIKAIFCARGGYGCLRLLEKIEQANLTAKTLIGFSDITSLHLYFATKNINCIHGPTVISNNFVGENNEAQLNRDNLHKLLFSHTQQKKNIFNNKQPIEIIKSTSTNKVIAELSGGCLSLLQTAIGTPEFISLKNKILLIEEVAEPVYRIDRMLSHLKRAKLFDTTKAVILGDFYMCPDDNKHNQEQIFELFSDILSDYDFPIIGGMPFGHDKSNFSWRYNQLAEIDCDNKIFYW